MSMPSSNFWNGKALKEPRLAQTSNPSSTLGLCLMLFGCQTIAETLAAGRRRIAKTSPTRRQNIAATTVVNPSQPYRGNIANTPPFHRKKSPTHRNTIATALPTNRQNIAIVSPNRRRRIGNGYQPSHRQNDRLRIATPSPKHRQHISNGSPTHRKRHANILN